jgi:hypothetical protein
MHATLRPLSDLHMPGGAAAGGLRRESQDTPVANLRVDRMTEPETRIRQLHRREEELVHRIFGKKVEIDIFRQSKNS